ncbi:MAG: NAD(P)-dependent oxidoreductase [Flavobacteriaceae bacterium]|nr:NAD(P)-dependent oxidoreductase [Flavobacteriaceae bacterium]
MMIYIISGVAGMTGNELARQLLAKGSVVVGFDNFFASSKETIKDLLANDNFHFFEYDLNDGKQMSELSDFVKKLNDKNAEINYINCAAVVHTMHFYEVHDTYETNVRGMLASLNQAIELGATKYINCSTSEVYSMQSWKEGGVVESDPILFSTAEQSQRTSYATGKLLTEFFMADAVQKNKIKGCSIRFANVYSETELHAKHIIPYIIDSFKKGNKITLLENSKVNKRTFLHNYDSCNSIIALLESDEALDGSVYNVATDEEVSIIELVEMIAKKMNIENPEIVFEGYRSADPVRRGLNVDKIKQRTTWQPKVHLSEGLDKCIEFRKRS